MIVGTDPAVIVNVIADDEPVSVGALEVILTLYPVPATKVEGSVQKSVSAPELVVCEPMVIGAAKLPAPFESCAVKIFPEQKFPIAR